MYTYYLEFKFHTRVYEPSMEKKKSGPIFSYNLPQPSTDSSLLGGYVGLQA